MRGPEVAIVSGSFGAGHDVAAAALADQLRAHGLTTCTWDVVDLLPGRWGRVARAGYLAQVQACPASWRWVLAATERHEPVVRAAGAVLESAGPALLDIAASAPALFVSTHPFASQALGSLRSSGRLDVPVATYLTDMSVHRLWVHPGVDLHLAIDDLAVREAERHGARRTVTVRPAVPVRFSRASDRRSARAALLIGQGLPPTTRPLALVVGGSCGIGRLHQTALDLASTGRVTPVVLCGRNDRLRARVARHPGMVGLGWVEDMPSLLAGVDVVVQNAGGMTSLEARATGTPVLTYRCVAGHGEANAAHLDATGMAEWVRDLDALPSALDRALSTGSSHQVVVTGVRQRPAAADVLLDLVPGRSPVAALPVEGLTA